ncbi:MAG: hypothetical protein M0Z31_04835 [Clostridia bacterium]|nr:hypothetical protein [Clostridia bacterium]
MVNGLEPCRKPLRPQYGEYRTHRERRHENNTSILKLKTLSLLSLLVLLLNSFGYTYAYFTASTSNQGNTFQTAVNKDFFEIIPGTAAHVWEPESHKLKERVAQYDDYGNLFLDFGIINDEGVKQFRDVLKFQNKYNKPLELDVTLEGPISEIITDWTRKIYLLPSGQTFSTTEDGDSGPPVVSSVYGSQSEIGDSVYEIPLLKNGEMNQMASAAVYSSMYNPMAEEPSDFIALDSSTKQQSMDFSFKGPKKTGTFKGKVVINGMNGYIRVEIPAVVNIESQMEKNVSPIKDKQATGSSALTGTGNEQNRDAVPGEGQLSADTTAGTNNEQASNSTTSQENSPITQPSSATSENQLINDVDKGTPANSSNQEPTTNDNDIADSSKATSQPN